MNSGRLIPTEASDADVGRWIWKNLVLKSGQCDTVQGELIHCIEKLCWEAQTNGNINWDDGFEMFVHFLRATLVSTNCLSVQECRGVATDLDRLLDFEDPYVEDDLYDRLTAAAVKFVRGNPRSIDHEPDPNQYR